MSGQSILTALLAAMLFAPTVVAHAQTWINPTADELKMTGLPEQPGAKAVVLNVDEICDDDNHIRSSYKRIKILTEAGKELGDVRIVFDKRNDSGFTVDEVEGRTIEPDGKIVPFTGKPFEKVLEKTKDGSYRGKVFSMPAVQVGSIIEYRYKLRWDDRLFVQPFWDVQNEELYVRKAHFLWKPYRQGPGLPRAWWPRSDHLQPHTWYSVLPPGQDIKRTRLPTGRLLLELDLHDIPSFSSEDYMPPEASSIYHVYFYYSPYHTAQEFWSTEGKYWSSDANKFIGNSDGVWKAAQECTVGAVTDEEKVRKLYALSQSIENTDHTRRHDAAEDRNEGLKEVKSAEDVLHRKRGSSNEIARVFVALARAEGFDASLMATGDRSRRLVNANWLEFYQLPDEVAIVNYGGGDHFFDPGSPYTTFGHLDWTHTYTGGVRQKIKTQPWFKLRSKDTSSHTRRAWRT